MRCHLIQCIPLSIMLIFTHSVPNQHNGKSIVIPGRAGMVFQMLSEKPAHMLVLPSLRYAIHKPHLTSDGATVYRGISDEQFKGSKAS
ncbi:hypothetical protein PSCFBP3800_04782 [Pseudomonas syringae group genomosp. 3]|uniref:Uncharacterized protein n=2 Tax=Pseudomonas syringae group TaxID=136849 RepID=A0A3M2W9Q8_PSEA0|nr:hypothetical protein ALQ94_200071 [Pseudomonas amygdali pv. morsprunorum]SOS36038.1 hypothetical protein CFBP6411_04681 [Pseudomonas syringae group genomosp. 3]SPF20235.1 hypothetical protein PSCFBP3800_04782 [Pseudomonas syringae group genomosp. 3]